MNNGLTREHVALLTAPFPARDHEFKNGFIYISEEAICDRLETVDPSWAWAKIELTYENDMATYIGRMTVCGVSRDGTGQQLATIDKNGKESVGEARKGATTDAMKRAARLFGIGRYLLQCPKDVKGHGAELNKWLGEVARDHAKATGINTPFAVSVQQSPAPVEYLHWSDEPGALDKMYGWALKSHKVDQAGVNALIAKTGKAITQLSKEAVMSLIAPAR